MSPDKVVIEPGEDFGFVAHVAALNGCWSQGRTRVEAMANIQEAIGGWLEAEQSKITGGRRAGPPKRPPR